MKVLLLTRYGRLGASSRLRAYQYLPYLRSMGIHVTALPLLGDYYQEDLYAGRPRRWGRITAAYLRRLVGLLRSPAFDLLWIEYELFPWLPAIVERLLATFHIPYVVDYDDPVYHRYELHRHRLVRLLLGRKIDAIMRCASTVIVGNSYLGDRARAAGAPRVEYVPTAVDLDRYPTRVSTASSVFTIGWIGSPTTVKYLSPLAPMLTKFCRETQARLVVVGARAAPLDGIRVELRRWSESTEVDDISDFDVGIMPLPDEPWERGKCGYKLIQYMACSRPTIASPVGVNSQLVETGVNGFLAANNTEWRSALDTLWATPDLRTRFGTAGRQKVETQYCTRVTAPRLAAILERTASSTVGES